TKSILSSFSPTDIVGCSKEIGVNGWIILLAAVATQLLHFLRHCTFLAQSAIRLEDRKFELLRAVTDTKRGLIATTNQRSSIEEALIIDVESLDARKLIDLRILDGTWRLQYTSAPHVLILLQSAATLPFFEVDQICQKFECGDESGHGTVRNVVKCSIPRLLEIPIQNVNISEELQALIAPSILPRSILNLQMYIYEGDQLAGFTTFGGVFIFTRAQSLIDLI
ncbi:putative plastid-lipid-associated protein 10, chloroplastic, partial [Primulina tabacum]|uniref:putative plastid-lipid-associated protein 10, chloroplastic n=1 Tax=Primulina tabacum TaxID=48773 RepID=UPI003F59D0EF